MNINELEILIEGQREHPGLDFKASCDWDAKKLTRDILAMSNLPDGGYIIIGVDEVDNSFVKSGVIAAVRKTYILDEMKDQIGKYADPMVDFDVFFPADSDGLEYVVIKVYSFREIPTICKKDLDKELKIGTIYYRNTNRRTESAAISNVNDLRDIIELSAVRLMQRRKSFGFIVPNENDDSSKAEIKSVNELEFVKRIKEKGFCEIIVTSLLKSKIHTLSDCLNAVEKSQVSLNWNLPVLTQQPQFGKIETFENGYQGTTDIGSRKEVWRMHQSENFYLLNSFVEDWLEGDNLRGQLAERFPSGQYFFFYASLLHHLTQFYAFLERLTTHGFYKEGIQIYVRFGNMAGRKLHLDDGGRVPLVRERITGAKDIIFEETYSLQQLLEESTRLSNSLILKVLEYFQYTPSSDSILIDQVEFLNKR
ncbi:ATP-binding protein [Sphingobacterium faecium]|uniref:AlbA family DNA-binding domain-containing protein n=1 Tax=Sphingobacterium faecium TaxID=34087 RepID=UPI00320BA2A3